MHNLQIYRFGNSFRVRFFENHVFDHSAPVRSGPDLVPTPFFDENWDRIYAPLIPSDDEIEFKRQESLRCSLSRSRNRIQHLALSFDKWKYFATFTFSPAVVDRYDYQACADLLQSFLHSLHINNLVYIIVPEMHEDGAFHFHGLFSDLPVFYAGKFYSRKAKDFIDTFYVEGYNFGYTNVSVIRNAVGVIKYLSSYLTKDFVAVSKGKRRYWYTYSSLKVIKPFKLLVNVVKCKEFLKNLSLNYFSYGGLLDAGEGIIKFKQCFIKDTEFFSFLFELFNCCFSFEFVLSSYYL